MITHQLIQGTAAWNEHRHTHKNASDAPCVMDCSPFTSRSELLRQRHTGITPEIDAATQRRFDDGHRYEALARVLAEGIVGEDLYPVVGSNGKYSASFDGITMGEDIIFEHKSMNDSIREADSAQELPEYLRVQMEHQLMVSGAKSCLFMASKWDNEGTPIEVKHFWYEPNQLLRESIVQAWEQFEKDLTTYVPVVHPEKPEAEAVMQLPALSIQTSGSISIISNLEVFGKKLNEFVEKLDLEPTDDQGFANAESAVKALQKAQDALEATEAGALAQAADFDEMRRTVALYVETARKTRLLLEKMVVARKKQIKEEVLTKARASFAAHVSSLEGEIKPIRLVFQQPDFIGAAKNKRTLASLHDSLDTELANAKIATDAIAKDVRAKLAWHKEKAVGYEMLFADLDRIIYKSADDFQMLVKNRIDQRKLEEKRKLEAERLRIQAEEQKKAEEKVAAQASEKFKAEQLVRAEQMASELDAIKKAQQAQQQASAAAQAQVVEAPKPTLVKTDPQQVIAERTKPLMIMLARRDLEDFRKKYSGIGELVMVLEEIDSFLIATAEPEAASA